MKKILLTMAVCAMALGAQAQTPVGETSITRWPDGKRGAVSITYDDGTVNQFRVAVPVMDRLGLPGTFYINTGTLPGSTWRGTFIGRSIEEIIEETKTIPTNADNVFERASAARMVPVRGADGYFTRAGAQIDAGRHEAAYEIMDDFYSKVVVGELEATRPREERPAGPDELTWDMARELTARGHEFSSHMVTHPYMAALDEPNLKYELEKSREEIEARIDRRSTIATEMPYGTNDDRAVAYMMEVYPASRNRMGLDYMLEIHRGGRTSPIAPEREYVQWQRGIVTRTTLDEMNGWVDTAAEQQNMWLVTVIHGVEGIGWEAMTAADLEAHFSHIASSQDKLWVATFGDAARYIHQRMAATVTVEQKSRTIEVEVDHPLDKELFDLPLTLTTRVDPKWKSAEVSQGGKKTVVPVTRDADGAWVMYDAVPGGGKVVLKSK